jgi:hypothetical protein
LDGFSSLEDSSLGFSEHSGSFGGLFFSPGCSSSLKFSFVLDSGFFLSECGVSLLLGSKLFLDSLALNSGLFLLLSEFGFFSILSGLFDG